MLLGGATKRAAGAFAGVLLVAFLAAYLWPVFLGGRATYLVVSGSSMEPTYRTGDLVIVHRRSDYRIGEIAAFRTDSGDVIHRIVGGDAESGFTMLGDNKPDIDPWTPTHENIIGTSWLHVPQVGEAIVRLRELIPLPVMLGGAALLLTLGGTTTSRAVRRRRRRRSSSRLPATPQEPTVAATESDTARTPGASPPWLGLGTMGLLLVLLVPATWTAVRTPVQATEESVHAFEHELEFAYTAHASGDSVVYPDGKVGPVRVEEAAGTAAAPPQEGVLPVDPEVADDAIVVRPPQALYTELIESLEIEIAYHPGAGANVSGLFSAEVVVATPDGWSTVIDTVAETPFEGASAWTTTVDLDQARVRILEVAEVTGALASSFTVAVAPAIDTTTDVDGEQRAWSVGAPLVFDVGPTLIAPAEQLHSISVDEVRAQAISANHVPLFGVDLTVPTARWVVLAAWVLLLLAAAAYARVIRRRYPEVGYRLLAGGRLVEIADGTPLPGRRVRVASFAVLQRMAKRDERVILHQPSLDGDRYFVVDGDLLFEYVEWDRSEPAPRAGRVAGPPPSPRAAATSPSSPSAPRLRANSRPAR